MHHIAFVLLSAFGLSVRRPGPAVLLGVFLVLAAWSLTFAPRSWDFLGFELYFECATTSTCYALAASDIEASFRAIANFIADTLGPNAAPAIVALYSLTSIAIKLYVFRKEAENFGVALFTYLCFGFFLHDLTQVRAGLAIAFLWLAMHLILTRRQWVAGVAAMAVSVLFHNSTLVILAALPLILVRLPVTVLLSLVGVAMVAGATIKDMVATDLSTFEFALDPRVTAYLAAADFDILVSPQFSIFGLCIGAVVAGVALFVNQRAFTRFERAAFISVTTGLMLYLAVFWLPIIGQRAFDVLASLLPFVTAAVFRVTRNPTPRIIMIAAASGIFLNAMVRNGLMLDFVLDGQAQEAHLLSRGVR